jgi:hypothetical protein
VQDVPTRERAVTRVVQVEFICGLLTPILAVIGFSIFMFAPIQTVFVSINGAPAAAQHTSIFSQSNGMALRQYLPIYALIFLLTLIIATSAAVHAIRRTRTAAIVLWVASVLLWIGTNATLLQVGIGTIRYPLSLLLPILVGLRILGPYLAGAGACALLACAGAIVVDARRRLSLG